MRDLMILIGVILLVLSAFSTPISIGIFLYDWNHGIEVSVAAWKSFKIWIELGLGGLLGFVLILFGRDILL